MFRSVFAATCLAVIAIASAAAAEKPAVAPWGADLSYMDKSVKPGDAFYDYSNGTWTKNSEIPADRSYAGVNLELNKQNEERLKTIVSELSARSDKDLSLEEQKLRDFYAAFTDQKQIEKDGMKPAQADLAAIAAMKTLEDVARMMGNPALQLDGPFNMYISIDEKHPDQYSAHLYHSGLGLPDRDYYLRDDKEIVTTREAYKKFLATMLGFAGAKDADKRATAVFDLENEIAKAHWPAEDRRDQDKVYNPMKISELKTFATEFPWDAYFAAADITSVTPKGERVVVVSEKTAFPKLAAIFAKTPISVWRDYLTTRYLHSFAAYLPKKVDEANFAFYGKVLAGNEQQLDRATRGVQLLDNNIGEALGKLYVAKYFPPEAKAKAKLLVTNLLKAYEADIKTLSWMTPATRAKALEKIHTFMPKIGYPDTWRDYSALTISRGDLVGDVKNAVVFEWNREVKRIDGTVDRLEWGMTPPTNNAYYNPTFNEIVFPAGILQPPFFDPNADDAVNYGEIGATIGHEISHGFDDQGSKFDAQGVFRNWWTESDRKNFDARTAVLAKQYDAYEPLPGIHIKGKLTLGENIADIAGLVIAYKAYHIALDGKPAPVLDGYTGDQRFYIAYGQSWRQKDRDGRLRMQLLSNEHSPPKYRVDAVVRNDDAWFAAFNVKPGDKLYLAPKDRVRLW
jgi:putative endopeptidase